MCIEGSCKMVLCWVDIDQKTGRVPKFFGLIWYRLTCGSPIYKFCSYDKLIQALLSWTLSQVQKILNKPCLRSMSTQPWYYYFWLNKNKRKKRTSKNDNAFKNIVQFSAMYQSFCCHVSKLRYMAEISIYFISRMPQKIFRTWKPTRQ